MEQVPPGWQGILEPGERILWQGQPVRALDLGGGRIKQALQGLPLLLFGLVWLGMTWEAARADPIPGLLFPVIGLIIAGGGFWRSAGHLLWAVYLRRHSWYTLTDRRAFIATEAFGRRTLRDWPVDAETLLDYDGATPGTIWFAEERRRGRVGFEMVQEARRVHSLMRQVQRRQA